jgi:hypothetical protein
MIVGFLRVVHLMQNDDKTEYKVRGAAPHSRAKTPNPIAEEHARARDTKYCILYLLQSAQFNAPLRSMSRGQAGLGARKR